MCVRYYGSDIVMSCLPWSGLGGSQRLGGCHPFHYECVAGLPHLLADFQYHGGQSLCGQVLLLFQWDIRGIFSHQRGRQQDPVLRSHLPKQVWGQVEECQNQLWQCGRRLSRTAASGESITPSRSQNPFRFSSAFFPLSHLLSFFVFVCYT